MEAFATEQEQAITQAYRFSLCQIAKEKEYRNVQDVVNWQTEHDWGIASRFCKGKEKSSPKLTRFREEKAEDSEEEIDLQIPALEEELLGLEIEEKVAKQKKVELLQVQIAAKKSKDLEGKRKTKPRPNNLPLNSSIRGTINHQRAELLPQYVHHQCIYLCY